MLVFHPTCLSNGVLGLTRERPRTEPAWRSCLSLAVPEPLRTAFAGPSESPAFASHSVSSRKPTALHTSPCQGISYTWKLFDYCNSQGMGIWAWVLDIFRWFEYIRLRYIRLLYNVNDLDLVDVLVALTEFDVVPNGEPRQQACHFSWTGEWHLEPRTAGIAKLYKCATGSQLWFAFQSHIT